MKELCHSFNGTATFLKINFLFESTLFIGENERASKREREKRQRERNNTEFKQFRKLDI